MKRYFYFILFTLIFCNKTYTRRSIHRPLDPLMPEIITQWNTNESKAFSLKSYYLESWPLERIELIKKARTDYALPNEILFRNEPEKKVHKKIIEKLLEELVKTITAPNKKKVANQKPELKNFFVLKDRDFNYKKKSGLLVVKFKEYPLIAKLYLETPETFTSPFSKGLEPNFFFVMGGGINRYLLGLTRIPNLHSINKTIKKDPYWSQHLTTPRKWFLIPKSTQWFNITTKNIGKKGNKKYTIPSAYVVICDEIKTERTFELSNSQDRQMGMKLSQFLGNRIDPHICNFLIEKDTGLIALIDTEHFASVVGLKRPLYFNHYSSWYTKLSDKCIQDTFLRSKRKRRSIQNESIADNLKLYEESIFFSNERIS